MRKMGTFLDAIILTIFIVISHKLLVGRERHPCACTRTCTHTHTHTHTQLQFLSIPVCLQNSWSSMSYEGNIWKCSCSPNISPLRSQTDNNSDYFVPRIGFLVLHRCEGSGPFHLPLDCWLSTVGKTHGGTNTTRAGWSHPTSPSSPSALLWVNCHHPQLE